MVIKTVYVDSNLGVEISSKKRGQPKTRARGGSFRSSSSWERSEQLTIGKEGFAWIPGLGGNYTD